MGRTNRWEKSELLRRTALAEDGCWNWTGTVDRGGYGHLSIGAKYVQAHRFAYSLFVGPIAAGMTIDHLCKNRRCVNPDHLEVISLRENVLRSDGPCALNARKTECKNGHPLSGDNLRVLYENGRRRRRCIACARAAQAAFKIRHQSPQNTNNGDPK